MKFPICPLCNRPIPPEVLQSRHHLVPKLKGGKGGETILVHQICHNEIHALFSEAELAQRLNTVDALRAEPKFAKFLTWVAKRPPQFHAKTPGGQRAFKKRRR